MTEALLIAGMVGCIAMFGGGVVLLLALVAARLSR